MDKYNHQEIEKKWQEKWDKEGLYVPDIEKARKPFYNLWMFPYPSGEGLHAGHAYASTGSDIYGRFMRMHGHEVLQPIGYDSFGIHSENFALKIGQHPTEMLNRTTKNFERQLRSLGHGYDWSRTVTTSEESYYRWTQWLFIQLFKAGLAYRKVSNVNWCPSCKTVLADEQVIDGLCERCQSIVGKKELMQWFFKITDYADRLLENLDKIDWPEKIKTVQRNWIGRSEGYTIEFKIKNLKLKIPVFTTRPDTLHGATFLALAPDYTGVLDKISAEKRLEIGQFIKTVSTKPQDAAKEKLGVFTGLYVTNPASKKQIPVWVVNYVAGGYGTGAIMGVPAHDERDREFATKYKIDIVDMKPNDAMKKYGQPKANYHLRDWLISRQRYWGPPIPMIYCQSCEENKQGERSDMPGWYSVPEPDLPVRLPLISDYQPEGDGRGPLAKHPEFYEVKCPVCDKQAVRETDVSDTFLDSSWYFLRYPSSGYNKAAFESKNTEKWMPVDLYFGGAEHAVLHLMYSRFINMVLFDQGYVKFEEPFPNFYAHGLMIKDGAKMSKSRGNVVNPDQYIEKFGADAFRLYLMFIGPMDGSPDFRDSGMEGMVRFVNRLTRIAIGADSPEVVSKLHKTITSVTADIERKHYNTAISDLMELVNIVERYGGTLSREAMVILAKLLAPFAPHLAEEMYQLVTAEKEFNSVHKLSWPVADNNLSAENTTMMVVQVNGVLRDRLEMPANYSSDKDKVEQAALESAKVQKYLNGAKYRAIFVPGKVINFVV